MNRFVTPLVALLGVCAISTASGCAFDQGNGSTEPVASTSSDLIVGGTAAGASSAASIGSAASPVPIARPVDATLRAGAPTLSLLSSGPGWSSYQVTGTLLDTDSQTLIAANEPIVVATSAAAIAAAPISASLKTRIASEVASLPADQQAGTFIVRKNIDNQVVAPPSKSANLAPLALGCSDVDKVYTKQFSSQTPFHYAQVDQTAAFTGNINLDGTASGNVTAGLTLHVSEVWIPFVGCTPYWGHLKNATLSGQGDVVADTKTNGHFAEEWHKSATVVEPVLYDDWISVGGLPVKITVSLPVQAGIDASARLDVNANAHVEAHGTFNLTCTSSSCDGSKNTTFVFGQNGTPTIGLNARAKINPWAEAGVKIELYDGVANGQVGVRATLGSDFWGYYGNTCGDANRDGVNEFVEAATLDASVLVDLHANVGFFGDNKSYAWNLLNQHVAFVDLLGTSSALTPMFYPDSTPLAPLTATLHGQMRPCYPYTDTVHYRIDWVDGSPVELFDAPAATTFARPHTFKETGLKIHSFSPTLEALTDVRGRQLNATSTSPALFGLVLKASN